MSASSFDCLVVGSGVAGTVAAVRLAGAGLRVAVTGRRAGGTALFSGAGQLFGPAGPALPARSPMRVERGSGSPPGHAALSAATRLEVLRARFPDHPFVRWGLDADTLGRQARDAVALLELPMDLASERVVLEGGVLREADLPLRGLAGSRTLGDGVVFVGLSDLPGVSSRWLARAWGSDASSVVAAPLDDAAGCGSPLAFAARLAGDEDRARRFVASVVAAVRSSEGRGAVVVPPVLGLTFAHRDRLIDTLSAALDGRTVVEPGAIVDSVWGVRTHRHLAGVRERAGLVVREEVTELRPRDGGWQATLADGSDVSSWSVVLAAGGHLGRACRPLALSAWLKSSMVASRSAEWSPWQDHAFLQEGVPVDSEGIAVPDGSGALEACGAVLGGHDPAHDGTGIGLGLVSGWLAAERLLARREGAR
ncbi:MAG: FAD-binding protein [Deltaproteobacteria bacterium]|nr:MAG: FAD-binding protein [Deltaproteobacteria bacterium]